MFTLEELAARVGGRIRGDASAPISGVRPFEEARKGDITLASGPRFESRLQETQASAVIVGEEIGPSDRNLLVVASPKLAFARILQLYVERPFAAEGVSSLASVASSASVPSNVSIHPFVVVGEGVVIEEEVVLHSGAAIGEGCRIGRGSVLHANVTLYPGVQLGRRVILHAGVVLGADGFGYVSDGDRQVKLPQTGNVVVEDDVEIGANSCVDRATFGSTVIERGVKLDNLVHIGHNSRIGENTIVVGCVGVSGSVTIGRNCILAGQSGVSDHVRIGDGSLVMAKTAVLRDVPAGSKVAGFYGRPHLEELRIQAALRQLPEMIRQWRKWVRHGGKGSTD